MGVVGAGGVGLVGAAGTSGVVGGTGGGSGGNPDLKPIRSTNLDAGLEWYFAKRSLLAATLFYMDLRNYVSYGSETKTYKTFDSLCPTGCAVPYNLTVPVNAKGKVDGIELAYQQAFTENFGFIGNYTYADGKQTSASAVRRRIVAAHGATSPAFGKPSTRMRRFSS